MNNDKFTHLLSKRPSCLVCCMFLELMVGMNYAISVFQIPLMEQFDAPFSTISLVFSLAGLGGILYSLIMAIPLRRVLGFKKMVVVGGFLYGFAYFATGLNKHSIALLFVTLLGIRMVGGLMVDVTVKSYAVELYPERAGWASGMTTAAFGAAAILWAPLVTSLITRIGDLSKALYLIGGALMICLVVAASRLIEVPAGFDQHFRRDLTMAAPSNGHYADTSNRYYNVNRSQMLRLPIFYLFLLSLALTMASGNALINQGAYYMEALLGTTAERAALSISALALGNMLGRLLFGAAADRFGMLNTILVAQAFSAVALVGCALASSAVTFTIAAMLVIFCFGGMYCLLSPLSSEIFGREHMTENFAIIVIIPNLAVLLGPTVASSIIDSTGSLPLTMTTLAVMAAVGAAAMFLTIRKLKQVQKEKADAAR